MVSIKVKLLISFVSLLRALPSTIGEMLGMVTVLPLYWLCRERRRIALSRIKGMNLPENTIDRSLYRFVRNLIFMLKDFKSFKIYGEERMERLKNGGIAISYHFGPWEAIPEILARRGYRMGVVVKNYQIPVVDRFLNDFRSRYGVEVFSASKEGEIFRIIKFIRAGGIVGTLIDGESFDQRFYNLNKIIEKFNIPVLPIFGVLKSKTLNIYIGQDLEAGIREYPYDYFWFYKSNRRFLM